MTTLTAVNNRQPLTIDISNHVTEPRPFSVKDPNEATYFVKITVKQIIKHHVHQYGYCFEHVIMHQAFKIPSITTFTTNSHLDLIIKD